MRTDDSDSLPFELWLSELGKLADASALYAADHEDRAVRRAFYLSKLAPPLVRILGNSDLDESTIEVLLEQGEAARAARLIAGERASIVQEERRGQRHAVTLSLAEDLCARCEANSSALALVCAWAGLFRTAPEPVLVRLAAAR